MSLLPYHPIRRCKASVFKRTRCIVLISILAAVIITVVGMRCLSPPLPTVATVDVNALIHRFIQTTTTRKLSSGQLSEQVHAFSLALEHSLHSVSQSHQVILLPKEAVLSGAADFTAQVDAQLRADLPSYPSASSLK